MLGCLKTCKVEAPTPLKQGTCVLLLLVCILVFCLVFSA